MLNISILSETTSQTVLAFWTQSNRSSQDPMSSGSLHPNISTEKTE